MMLRSINQINKNSYKNIWQCLRFSSSSAIDIQHTSENANVIKYEKKDIWVAGVENYSPLSRVSVVTRAGSRYEHPDSLGVVHALRESASLGSKDLSSFKFVRNMEQIGAIYTCTATREYLIYSVEVVRDYLIQALELLNVAFSKPEFKLWEFPDTIRRMNIHLDMLESQPERRVVEAIHKAAFAGPLSNSLYATNLDHISASMCKVHLDENATPDRTALIGFGCSPEILDKVSNVFARHPSGAEIERLSEPLLPTASKSRFVSGEVRIDTNDNLVHTIIASNGFGLNNPDYLASAVLQRILGLGPVVKHNNVSGGKFFDAAKPMIHSPFAVSCFAPSYSDHGLFGFHLVSQPNDTGKLLDLMLQGLRQLAGNGITEIELVRAKTQLKADMGFMSEMKDVNSVEDMASQLFVKGQVSDYSSVCKQVDAVTVDDVNKVVKKVVNAKPAMATIGRLSHTPRLHDLI